VSKSVSRKEDMSPRGQLLIHVDDQGDIGVVVYGDDGDGMITSQAGIEFCSCGGGGGKSHKTRLALVELMKAMEEDNKEYPSRKGDM